MKKVIINHFTSHDLRRTHAQLVYQDEMKKVIIKVFQELNHSSTTITKNHYLNFLDSTQINHLQIDSHPRITTCPVCSINFHCNCSMKEIPREDKIIDEFYVVCFSQYETMKNKIDDCKDFGYFKDNSVVGIISLKDLTITSNLYMLFWFSSRIKRKKHRISSYFFC